MSKLNQILSDLKQGNNYAFSYTSRAAAAHFNIEISYLNDKSLYNIHTLEKPASGNENLEYNEEVEEAKATKYIEDELARAESRDTNGSPAAKRPK